MKPKQELNCVFCMAQSNPGEEYRIIKRQTELFVVLTQMPQNLGHLMVIPTAHYSTLTEIPKKILAMLLQAAIAYGEKLQKRLQAKAYVLRVNNNLYLLEDHPNNNHVGHIHFHVIPRYKAEDSLETTRPSEKELTQIKKQLSS